MADNRSEYRIAWCLRQQLREKRREVDNTFARNQELYNKKCNEIRLLRDSNDMVLRDLELSYMQEGVADGLEYRTIRFNGRAEGIGWVFIDCESVFNEFVELGRLPLENAPTTSPEVGRFGPMPSTRSSWWEANVNELDDQG